MAASRKPTAMIAVLVLGVAGLTGIAYGHGSHELTRTIYSSVIVEDEIDIEEKEGAAVTVYSLKLGPGVHSPWHYHPGPHIVSVKTGPVRVYETDCTYREYPAGTGFYDPGQSGDATPHVHTFWNPTDKEVEIVITDVRTEDPRLAIVVDPQPKFCDQRKK